MTSPLAQQQYDNLWCEMPSRLAELAGISEEAARRHIGRWTSPYGDNVPPGELKAMIEATANRGGVRDVLAYIGAMIKRRKEGE